jgi:hypothetical protein
MFGAKGRVSAGVVALLSAAAITAGAIAATEIPITETT